MPGLGHLPEILLICLVALVILGPKRMIDIASALGRAVRELREATKDLNWSSLLDTGESSTSQRPSQRPSTTLGAISQFTQSLTQSVKEMGSQASSSPPVPTPVTPPTSQSVVDSAVVDSAVVDSAVVDKESDDRQAGTTEDEA